MMMSATTTTTTTTQQSPSSQSPQLPALTSTTAPGKIFATRAELAAHYKSSWHKYNLKRREAGLPVLLEPDFEARLAAAQEALQQKEKPASGRSHLKDKDNPKKHRGKKTRGTTALQGATATSAVPSYLRMKDEAAQQQQQQQAEEEGQPEQSTIVGGEASSTENLSTNNDTASPETAETLGQLKAAARVEIDPRQCLFDRHISASVEDNVERMHRKYGFFLPDREYLVDLEGLIGFCHEKIKIGRVCLYCQKGFSSFEACQKHMISKQHTKLRYEAGVDLDEFEVFYDFREADTAFLQSNRRKATSTAEEEEEEKVDSEAVVETVEDGNDEDAEDDEWEDISDDEEVKDDEDDAVVDDDDDAGDDYSAFEEEVANMGLDVTELGELVFPDGRVIGHRSLRRYYRQRAPRLPDNRLSVVAAREAAGDRLVNGQVINIYGGSGLVTAEERSLRRVGIKKGFAAGRSGAGILNVAAGGAGYSQVSVYRFRAALKKQRRDDEKGMRLYNRTKQNINRMDKKHNRLMNGVSVAHAAR